MVPVLPTRPVTDMNRVPSDVLAMLDKNPVVLMLRSQPAAVMVHPDQWNAIAEELQAARNDTRLTKREVEAVIEGMRNKARGGPTISHEELKQMVMERSANVAN